MPELKRSSDSKIKFPFTGPLVNLFLWRGDWVKFCSCNIIKQTKKTACEVVYSGLENVQTLTNRLYTENPVWDGYSTALSTLVATVEHLMSLATRNVTCSLKVYDHNEHFRFVHSKEHALILQCDVSAFWNL